MLKVLEREERVRNDVSEQGGVRAIPDSLCVTFPHRHAELLLFYPKHLCSGFIYIYRTGGQEGIESPGPAVGPMHLKV